MRKSLIAVLAGAIVTFSNISYCLAGDATETIQEKQESLFLAIQSGNQKETNNLFDQLIDFDFLAKDCLGSEWDGRTETERKEYLTLFRKVFRKSYQKNLKETLKHHYRYDDEEITPEGTFITMLISDYIDDKEGVTVLHLKSRRDGESWKIIDVIIDGESIAATYRSQFGNIIRKNGFPTLLDKLRKKAG
jgi:phospholipid transport system substrate-binding protein